MFALSRTSPALISMNNAETARRAAASSASWSTEPITILRCVRLPLPANSRQRNSQTAGPLCRSARINYTFSIPASRIFMSRLFMTLAPNIQLYPQWVAYLKCRQPKTLIVWGRNDPLFLPAAPEFVKQIVPTADVRYFDGSHFVLDEYADAVAEAIIETFSPIAGMRN